MRTTIFASLISLMLFSCSNEPENIVSNQNSSASEVLDYIKSLGYKADDIKEYPDKYVVEGDMVFKKHMQVAESKEHSQGRVNQRYTGWEVGFVYQNNIRVKIDQSMIEAPDYTNQIHDAINEWNTARYAGSRIIFRVVTGNVYGTDYDIRIFKDNTISPSLGWAEVPQSNRKPGIEVRINKQALASYSVLTRKTVVLHELGHTLSFKHTNSSDGIPVPGYDGPDSYSVMDTGGFNPVLSTMDKGATAVLYPTELPFNLGNSGQYPWVFSWNAPLYAGYGTVLGFEVKYTRYDYQGRIIESPVTLQTATSYTLPFTAGQYPGQNAVFFVRAQFSNGTYSNWISQSCTL